MVRIGHKYSLKTNGFGAEIVRLHDGASVFMQGDDAVEIESQMDALEATAETGYPKGPFADYESHLDAILDAYDTVLQ